MTALTELSEELLQALENRDMEIVYTGEQDGELASEIEFYSPAGEDVIVTIFHDGTDKSFADAFSSYSADFDPDEHAEMWVEGRGKNGVPSSIRELIEDADAISDILRVTTEELYKAISRRN